MNDLIHFWREFDYRKPPYIHPRDLERCGTERGFVDRRCFNHAGFVKSNRFPGEDGFHFSLLPVPYLGDLQNADIFILLLNPGFSVSNYQTMQDVEYRMLAVKSLRQDFRGNEFPFMSLDPRLSTSAGFLWWHGKFAKIIRSISDSKGISYLAAMKAVAKRVAAVELVPYRSKKFSAGRLTNVLPSAIAAKEFVRHEVMPRVRRGDAIVIVTRQAKEWGVSGNRVVVYKGGHTRGAHLGPGTRGGDAILRRFGIVRD